MKLKMLSAAVALVGEFPELNLGIYELCATGPFRLRPRETLAILMTLPPSEQRDALLSACLGTANIPDPAVVGVNGRGSR